MIQVPFDKIVSRYRPLASRSAGFFLFQDMWANSTRTSFDDMSIH